MKAIPAAGPSAFDPAPLPWANRDAQHTDVKSLTILQRADPKNLRRRRT